jgi:hypothetical protein
VSDLLRLPRLLTEVQAAKELGVSIDTLQRLRKKQAIRYRRIGGRIKYTLADLYHYINSELRPCANDVNTPARSPDTGLASGTVPTVGTAAGTTAGPDRLGEFHSAQSTLMRPRSNSRAGSPTTPTCASSARSK